MTTIVEAVNLQDYAKSGGSRPSYFERLLAAFREWNQNRMTRNELSSLSDRELDDIGLSRAMIPFVTAARKQS